jgi:uncharacterized protein (TIGR02246 family)
MKRNLISTTAQLAVVLGFLGVTPQGLAQSLEEEVTAAYAAWDEAFNAGDADGVASTYTEDALFLPATHDVINGSDAVGAFFAGLFEMGVTGHKLDLIEVREDGDAVVGAANWSAVGKDAEGNDQPWSGLATTVFERQDDGSLKLMLHTFN